MTTEVSPWLHEILILKLFVTIYHCHLGEYPIPMSVGSGYLLLFIVLISCALIYYYYYYLLAPYPQMHSHYKHSQIKRLYITFPFEVWYGPYKFLKL
jgi:hypothetical protein